MTSVWYSASGFIATISPLINYGLGHINGSLSPLRYMFLVGGVLTILWAVIILLYLPPDPIRAKGFSERERYIAVARLRVNNAGVRNTHFKAAHARELLIDEKFWLVFVMALLSMVAAGPVNAFAPIIIAGFGYSTLNSLLLLMPAGAVAGLMILAATFIAYKVPRSRIWVIFVCQMITVLSALLLWLLPRDALGGLLFALYILAGFTGGWGVLMGLTIANAAGYTKRMLASSGVYIGYCLGESYKGAYCPQSHDLIASGAAGQFIGPLLFRPRDAPSYGFGFAAVVITAAATAVIALVYGYICVWHNRRRDSAGTMESFEHAFEDDLTDKKVMLDLVRESGHANTICAESSISLFSLTGTRCAITMVLGYRQRKSQLVHCQDTRLLKLGSAKALVRSYTVQWTVSTARRHRLMRPSLGTNVSELGDSHGKAIKATSLEIVNHEVQDVEERQSNRSPLKP